MEELFKILLENQNADRIVYTNTNGFEKLVVDNKVVYETPKDELKSIIAEYKELVDVLPDCLFVEICEDLADSVSLIEFDKLLHKEKRTDEDTLVLKKMMQMSFKTIYKHIVKEINSVNALQEQVKTLNNKIKEK